MSEQWNRIKYWEPKIQLSQMHSFQPISATMTQKKITQKNQQIHETISYQMDNPEKETRYLRNHYLEILEIQKNEQNKT